MRTLDSKLPASRRIRFHFRRDFREEIMLTFINRRLSHASRHMDLIKYLHSV